MYIAPPDRTLGEEEWRPFVEAQGFGHLIAPGRDRDLPVVVPTQFLLDGSQILLHLARPNPIFSALAESPRVVMSVAGDWAFIPSSWKAIGDEDPALGIPTTYYAAVQLSGTATVHSDASSTAEVLRAQLHALQPHEGAADPLSAHASQLSAIRGITVAVTDVRAKFKYGGNVDDDHRAAVVERLRHRGGPGDSAAAEHTVRRSRSSGSSGGGSSGSSGGGKVVD